MAAADRTSRVAPLAQTRACFGDHLEPECAYLFNHSLFIPDPGGPTRTLTNRGDPDHGESGSG